MEQTPNTDSPLFDLSITESCKDHLRKIASWSLIIVICAVIGYIITLFKAFQPRTLRTGLEGFSVQETTGTGIGSAILAIVVGLLVNYFLFQFSNKIKKGIGGMSRTDLNAGFYNLKMYFIIVGVLIIIMFVLALLVILAFGINGPQN
jgi:uncharacterized membrane protein YjgN (DUF898 family)